MGESRETAISIAIGVQPRTAVDVFDFLRPQLLESLFWRQRLPVLGNASALSDDELRAACTELFKHFSGELCRLLSNPRQAELLLGRMREEATTKDTKNTKE
jgi:hypothetical protein